MPQASTTPPLLPILLATLGYAMAGVHLWPSLHVALSNGSVFVNYDTRDRNTSSDLQNQTLSLFDMQTNVSLLTRTLPINESEGRLEFNCSCFLYAGTFRFRLEQTHYATANSKGNATANASVTDRDGDGRITAIWWWSSELQVVWPTFHIAVGQNNNQSGSFQVGISTNELFQSCAFGLGSALFLEVSYLEFNQIGRNSIDKVRARIRHPIKTLRSQTVDLSCAFYFTDQDFIRVALHSPHTDQDVKSSGPLYLSRIFSYKLLVDNVNSYKTGCEGVVSVHLVTPPCALINGKVLLYRDRTGTSGGKGGAEVAVVGEAEESPLAFNWLTQGENVTEFNCSVFDPGRNKYCFRFVLNYSRSPTPKTCLVVHRNAESWGPWQPWSVCSVSCGDGVRERVRVCLLSSGGGSVHCIGMVKEQSICSLEDCTVLPPPSPSPLPPPSSSPLGSNLVAVAGVSLCLAVILATVLVTLWRKLCRTRQCSSVRRSSTHSPGGRKLSDEASICGHSLQRPSLSDSQGNQGHPGGTGPARTERPNLGRVPLPQPPALVGSLVQDPDRLSPSGQKVLPPIFGYRLAQQQLKEMKKKGLKEATQIYHVSQSPVQDTLLEGSSVSTPTQPQLLHPGHTPSPGPLDLQCDDSSLRRFQIMAPFPEARAPQRSSATPPDRLSPRVELILGPPTAGYGAGGNGSSKRWDRTADWVEMVERSGFGGMAGGDRGGLPSNSCQKNPNFRRTSSFHDTKPSPPPAASCQPYRERSKTQVGLRTRALPEGSCKTRGTWENQNQTFPSYPIPEHSAPDWAMPKSKSPGLGETSGRPWVDTGSSFTSKPKHTGKSSGTSTAARMGSELLMNSDLIRERKRSGAGGDKTGGGGGEEREGEEIMSSNIREEGGGKDGGERGSYNIRGGGAGVRNRERGSTNIRGEGGGTGGGGRGSTNIRGEGGGTGGGGRGSTNIRGEGG
uniref:Thrombospondin, type I, domain containing 1 n=2 Tax=Esox lucius TaxID=8010 RepID=A0AAY5L8M2_ESOLU